MRVKEENGGPLQLPISQQSQLFEQLFVTYFKILRGNPPAASGLFAENTKTRRIEISDLDEIHGGGIPFSPGLSKQKFRQQRPSEFLLGAAATIVIFAAATYRVGDRRNNNFDDVFSFAVQ